MTRTVRISPVPIPPPAAEPRAPRRPAGPVVGAVLVLVAALCFAGHVLLAGDGDHAWDRHPTPPASVHLTAGTTYHLSTTAGLDATPVATPLSCTYTGAQGSTGALAVMALDPSSRATHAVASFIAPVTGSVAVACSGGVVGARAVFVDDADDHGGDAAAWLLLLSIVAAVPGVGLLLGAGFARPQRHRVTEPTAADVATRQ